MDHQEQLICECGGSTWRVYDERIVCCRKGCGKVVEICIPDAVLRKVLGERRRDS